MSRSDEQTLAWWKALLLTDFGEGDGDLYDRYNGIRPEIMRAFGFHDQYLSFSSTPKTQHVSRAKRAGPNNVSVAHVVKAFKGKVEGRILSWNFCLFFNQSRSTIRNTRDSILKGPPHGEQMTVWKKAGDDQGIKVMLEDGMWRRLEADDPRVPDGRTIVWIPDVPPVFNTEYYQPQDCHARGVFFFRPERLFVVYEPRIYVPVKSPWFGSALNDFAKQYKSCEQLLVYGNQVLSEDCEKRVLRFGMCCWNKFKRQHTRDSAFSCRCGLKISAVVKYRLRDK